MADAVLVFAYATALPMRMRDGVPVLAATDAALVARPFAGVLIREGHALEPSNSLPSPHGSLIPTAPSNVEWHRSALWRASTQTVRA